MENPPRREKGKYSAYCHSCNDNGGDDHSDDKSQIVEALTAVIVTESVKHCVNGLNADYYA